MSTSLSNPAEIQPSRPAHLRHVNTRALLSLLRGNGPCSRADLVRMSGLSAPTVTAAIADLEAMGLVEMMGEGQSSGGRPPEMLRFRAEHGFVAGADIGGTRLRMVLSDLNGTPVSHWKGILNPDGKDPASICDAILNGLQVMCTEAGVPMERVMQMVVGAPGITDVDRGIVLAAPNLTNWNNVPLRDLLQEKIGINVIAENDTNLAAVGEHWRGAARGVEDFVFVAMGTGVGSGIFLRGRLLHGAAWSAGEIGYLGVPGEARDAMKLSSTGQLERAIGGEGIEHDWRCRLQASGRDAEEDLMKLRASHIFDQAETGDKDAVAVLERVATIVADALGTITLLFNPGLVVMGGGVGSHPALCAATEKMLETTDFPHPQIRSSQLNTDAQLFGAVSLALAAVETKLVA